MKKISLKNLKLEAGDMLQRNQLKSVIGGHYGIDTCSSHGYNNGNYSFNGGNGYSGCVSYAAAQNGANYCGTQHYFNPNCNY